ncbi:MAG: MMPL family transporter, partial [Dehalococcoidia bacterium]|nr:MMPL family transporter [Dehalococcoidia bacterium]
YLTGDESLVTPDRRTTLIPLTMPNDALDSSEKIDQVFEIVDEAGENASFQILITGMATMTAELIEIAERDLQAGEGIGIGAALVVLALVFGAIAAALLPIALAIAAIAVALGATALVGQAMELSFFITNMFTMIGLAVGIDYSLFIVSRYREERARGLEKVEAIAAAGDTAGRAVVFSGMTVVLALFGLLIFPLSTFQAMGAGAILVVIAAVLASMTLLPAILGLMGDRINALRNTLYPAPQGRGVGRGGFWQWSARTVMRRPVVGLLVATGVLLALAVSFLDLNKGFSGISTLPDGLRGKEGFLVTSAGVWLRHGLSGHDRR